MRKAYDNFFSGRRIFITGHTGFKGTWLCRILTQLGAEVSGYALAPPTVPSLFEICEIGAAVNSIIGDVRDINTLRQAFEHCRPEIVLHLAAQPIVRDGYRDPRYTFETNIMGTVNILECIRQGSTVKSFLNVTTDKVYANQEWEWGYREIDPLDGHDPYSNSKSCSELVTHSYQKSFFSNGKASISTARAGNVIGGGDFAKDRIIPDCLRAVTEGRGIRIRNPNSIRPYQHVLEPLSAYLTICAKQYNDVSFASSYNVGPDERSCVTTEKLASIFCSAWGEGASWTAIDAGGPHEANFLKLDCSKIKRMFGWAPRWVIETAVAKTVEWAKCWQSGGNTGVCMDKQIAEYFEN